MVGTAAAADEIRTTPVETLRSMDLEDLLNVKVDTVYGASKREQKVTEAPASVTILTADDFRKLGYRNLAEALRGARGIYLTNDRNYTTLGIRGFSRPGDLNSRILVLVDGHRVTENIYDSSYLANDFVVDADLIDRVEIIRGPGSALYGSSAFFGVVNVVTRRGRDLHGLEASFDAGSFDAYKGRLSFGRVFESGIDLVLSGSVLDLGGAHSLYFPDFDRPSLNGGRAIDLDYERARSGLATLAWSDLTLQLGMNWREKGVPTASFDSQFGDPRLRTTDSLGFADLKYEHEFENELNLMARVNFNRYRYFGNYPQPEDPSVNPPDITVNRDDVLGQWLGTEVQIRRPLGTSHQVTAGAEYRENLNQNVYNFDLGTTDVYSDLDHRSSVVGVFLMDAWTLHPKLVLDGGVRLDHYDTFGATLNPRAAAIYHPWETSSWKLLYGEAFRAPNIWEAFVEDPTVRANPALGPEKIRTAEVVYEQQLPRQLAFSVSAYYSWIEDLIDPATDPVTQLEYYDNLEGAESRGVEFEFSGRTSRGMRGRISYALQETVRAGSGSGFDNSPAHLAKADLVVPLYRDRIFGGLGVQYYSSVNTLAGARTDPYWLLNLTLYSREIAPGLEMSASIYNLLNDRFAVPGGAQHVQDVIPQDGLTFRVKLTYRF